MQEPTKKDKTPEEIREQFSRDMEKQRLEDSWVITEKIPAVSRNGTISLWNYLIKKELATFLVYINGAGHREIIEFIPMTDRYFITVICKDKIKEQNMEFIVPCFTTFGVFLNSDKWFLSYE